MFVEDSELDSACLDGEEDSARVSLIHAHITCRPGHTGSIKAGFLDRHAIANAVAFARRYQDDCTVACAPAHAISFYLTFEQNEVDNGALVCA